MIAGRIFFHLDGSQLRKDLALNLHLTTKSNSRYMTDIWLNGVRMRGKTDSGQSGLRQRILPNQFYLSPVCMSLRPNVTIY
ncbi:hypothetical protein CEXT_630441 [Caerostris extrusa]|uniref:Uncharacterized protein n=1 Tax=Caerostris extrusa TaxID=172846 RepID=A0AAV4V9Q5_CAEEX|nr:hypothetical protein CEXT_630441 [Caerostris extrusa]